MLAQNACPRCRGTLARVQDIDDTYHSCVQCGHVVYGALLAATPLRPADLRPWQQPKDRSDVRRGQLRRAKEQAARSARAA